MAKNKMVLLSGNAHPELSRAIANELDTNLVAATVGQFPDGETEVKIKDNVREKDVFVLQPTGPPVNQNLMESLVIIDALRRASAGRITAVIPYFGYARQDRKDQSRVPITAKLAANVLEAAGVDRLLAVDLHAAQIQGFTDLPFDHLYAGRTMRDALETRIDNPVVAAPDVGAAKMAKGFARRWGADWVIVDKDRIDGSTTEVTSVVGTDVKDRNVVIVDDIATTAGSLLNAADALKDRGAAHVIAAVTHGVLCDDAIEKIETSNSLDRLFVTDSLPKHWDSELIEQVTIAPLLAQAIRNIHKGSSVSELF